LAVTRYVYGGRGYLRFATLTAAVPGPGGTCEVRVYRGGPSRARISIQAADGVAQPEVDRLAEQVRGQVIVFCQAPIRDFGLDSSETIADDGSAKRSAFARTLGRQDDLIVCVPFEHQTDMSSDDVKALEDIIATSKAIPLSLVTSIEHSLTQAEGDVEAFLAIYAVLQSVLGGKQADVDSFILGVQPNCEIAKDSRGRKVTIYTKLRNAKGHPTGMPPDEASKRISNLLPKLRQHVKTALFRSTAP